MFSEIQPLLFDLHVKRQQYTPPEILSNASKLENYGNREEKEVKGSQHRTIA